MADGEMSLFSLVWMALTGMYLGTTTLSVYNLFYPPRCRGPGCLQPKMPPGAMVDVRAYVLNQGDGDGDRQNRLQIWNATNVSVDGSGVDARIVLPVPGTIRRGELRELWVEFELLLTEAPHR